MKCDQHLNDETITSYSKCGKISRTRYTNKVDDAFFYQSYGNFKTADRSEDLKKFLIIDTVLGCLGAVNILFIGVYVAMYCFHVAVIFEGNFEMIAYLVSTLVAVLVSTLLFGSYLTFKGRLRKGGILNLAAGISTVLIYLYFILRIPLLRRFGVIGVLLCTPAVLSGILSILSEKLVQKKVDLKGSDKSSLKSLS